MNKQHWEKPVTLFEGYRQNNSNNYPYRINNPLWGVNERISCKTPDKEQAKIIAIKAWNRYEVMKEFNLISKQGETFIQFAERVVIPPLISNTDRLKKHLKLRSKSNKGIMRLINVLTT